MHIRVAAADQNVPEFLTGEASTEKDPKNVATGSQLRLLIWSSVCKDALEGFSP